MWPLMSFMAWEQSFFLFELNADASWHIQRGTVLHLFFADTNWKLTNSEPTTKLDQHLMRNTVKLWTDAAKLIEIQTGATFFFLHVSLFVFVGERGDAVTLQQSLLTQATLHQITALSARALMKFSTVFHIVYKQQYCRWYTGATQMYQCNYRSKKQVLQYCINNALYYLSRGFHLHAQWVETCTGRFYAWVHLMEILSHIY